MSNSTEQFWDKEKSAEFAFYFKNMDTNNVSVAMDMFEQHHPSKQSAPLPDNKFEVNWNTGKSPIKEPTPTVTDKPVAEDKLVIESRAFYAGMDGRYKTFSDYKQNQHNHEANNHKL